MAVKLYLEKPEEVYQSIKTPGAKAISELATQGKRKSPVHGHMPNPIKEAFKLRECCKAGLNRSSDNDKHYTLPKLLLTGNPLVVLGG